MKKCLFIVAVLYASFLHATVYTRVHAKPDNGWGGTYLIGYVVSDTLVYIWDGTDDAANYVSVTLANGKISATNLDSYQVTIAAEGRDYSVRTADGYIGVGSGDNKIEFNRGAQACTITENGGYVMLETNTHTERFVFNKKSNRFRFYYDSQKKWADTQYKNICLFVLGDIEVTESKQSLDINYAQAELYACDSKFPTTSDPYNQYFSTFLWLLQEEDEMAVPQIGLEILAPTQYSIAGTYRSDYTPNKKYYLNITNGSKHSFFTFPNKSEEGYGTAAIRVAEMTISKVNPSTLPNAYVYHILLEFTDSNGKIWHLDKDLDVYGWWIDCDRSNPKQPTDMQEVAFALESGNHIPAGFSDLKKGDKEVKFMRNGHLILRCGEHFYNALGQLISTK